jgi:hypothetical protein
MLRVTRHMPRIVRCLLRVAWLIIAQAFRGELERLRAMLMRIDAPDSERARWAGVCVCLCARAHVCVLLLVVNSFGGRGSMQRAVLEFGALQHAHLALQWRSQSAREC